MSLETLERIISGRRKPSLVSALRLAEALDLEVEDVIMHELATTKLRDPLKED